MMSTITTERMQRARKARETLAAQFLDEPLVTMIDISKTGGAVTVRIHLNPRAPRAARPAFPEEMYGIPVIVVAADYRPE